MKQFLPEFIKQTDEILKDDALRAQKQMNIEILEPMDVKSSMSNSGQDQN